VPTLIPHSSTAEQQQLLADLNYLNLAEMRAFCRRHSIPWKICVQTADGARQQTNDTDRKSVVLGRVRHYLRTGHVPDATCFPAAIVRRGGPPKQLAPADRLYYGWYDKTSRAMVGLLQRLTAGKFRSGAIARILAREFWTAGEAPTFIEFAKAWTKANARGLGVREGLHPEAAWLTDRARKQAGPDWKQKRRRIARRVLQVLGTVRRR